ncbi:MAG: RNA polymerase sigma factor [Acidobacteriota bacterium]
MVEGAAAGLPPTFAKASASAEATTGRTAGQECPFAGAAVGQPRAGLKRVKERQLRADKDAGEVRAFREGDREAFDRLVEKYQQRVYRICLRFTGNHHDADDLAQDVFVRVFRALSRFRAEARFSTWLHRITVNACFNWARGRKRRFEALTDDLRDPAPGQIERLGRKELSATVRREVARLPERQRIILVLRVYQELSHREIAELLKCPVGTVKANFFFALQNLKKGLEGSVSRTTPDRRQR